MCQVGVECVKCVSSVSSVCRMCQVCVKCVKRVSSASSVYRVCQVCVECMKRESSVSRSVEFVKHASSVDQLSLVHVEYIKCVSNAVKFALSVSRVC